MAMNDKEIISTLKKMVDSAGVSLFNNHARANAFSSDFFPGNDNAKTRKLIKSLIDTDAFVKISAASDRDLDGVCKAAKMVLVDEESLSEDRAEMAIGWVCGALGKRKPNFPKPVQPPVQQPVQPPVQQPVQPQKPAQPPVQPQKPVQPQSSNSSGAYSYGAKKRESSGASTRAISGSSYNAAGKSASASSAKSAARNNTYGLNLNHHIKRKKKVPKKLIGWTITLCVLAALAYFVVWPKIIYPNMANEELYTPEIIQTYSGTYSTGNVEGNGVVTITSCDQSGNLTGFFEFIVGNAYGKYEITGMITEKKNNGNLVLSLNPGQWVIQPDNFITLETMTVKIIDEYQSFECSQYSMYWSIGGNDEYSVKTVDDLQKLVGSEATYQLKNDIDLSGVNWTPIEGFKGTFIGNGYTIKNLKIETSAHDVGFFSTLTGTVANLNFENANITVQGSRENIGILCGTLQGSAHNVSTSGTIKADNCQNVGGIAGLCNKSGNTAINNLTNTANVSALSNVGGIFGGCIANTSDYSNYTINIDNFTNEGDITGDSDYVGGLIGYLKLDESDRFHSYTLYMSDLQNNADVSGKAYVGGLIGYGEVDSNTSYIKDSSSSGAIKAEACVGCIAGKLISIAVNNCSNEGSTLEATKYITEEGYKYAYVGGYVGYGYLVQNCTNTVNINHTAGGYYVGGIIGYTDAEGSVSMQNLKNTASISGEDAVGGIIGGWITITSDYSNYTINVSDFRNEGDITGAIDCVGGLIGYIKLDESDRFHSYTLYTSDLQNSANVSGKAYVGGLIGYGQVDSNMSYIKDSSSNGTIKAEACVGCIAGVLSNISVDSCSNEGSTLEVTKYVTVSGDKYAYAGGYVGYGYLVQNCTNAVSINYTSSGSCVGGIMGYTAATENISMQNLKNTASISGEDIVGGIIGGWIASTSDYSEYTINIDDFVNEGDITGGGEYVGGLIGYIKLEESDRFHSYTLYMTDLQNLGAVHGAKCVGGLIGYGETDSEKSSIVDYTASGSVTGSSKVNAVAGRLVNIAT